MLRFYDPTTANDHLSCYIRSLEVLEYKLMVAETTVSLMPTIVCTIRDECDQYQSQYPDTWQPCQHWSLFVAMPLSSQAAFQRVIIEVFIVSEAHEALVKM